MYDFLRPGVRASNAARSSRDATLPAVPRDTGYIKRLSLQFVIPSAARKAIPMPTLLNARFLHFVGLNEISNAIKGRGLDISVLAGTGLEARKPAENAAIRGMNGDCVFIPLSNRSRSANVAGAPFLSPDRQTVARSTAFLIANAGTMKKNTYLNAQNVWRRACNEMLRDEIRREESHECYGQKDPRYHEHLPRNTP
jgi:hypothetical protein